MAKVSGWFSLEVVYAGKGDALILHYGARKAEPRWMLIDGGHKNVYDKFLRPRLEQLALSNPRHVDDRGRLPLELLMVSHADEDHLMGVLDLAANMRNDKKSRIDDRNVPQAPVTINEIWFNGFSDLIAQTDFDAEPAAVKDFVEAASVGGDNIPMELLEDSAMHDVVAVIASTAQGRRLLDDADFLNIDVNERYGNGLVMRGGDHDSVTEFDDLNFTLLGPDKRRIDKLRNKWKKDLKKILKKEREQAERERAADLASFRDSSPFNLSSIMVLAKRKGKTMLLTGDARGDDLIDGLKAEKLLDRQGRIEVDLFKLPHHGSDRNVKDETFRDIIAEHYVISANGEHGNPEPATMDMLVKGRELAGATEEFFVYFSFPEAAHKLITEAEANKKKKVRKQKDALKGLDTWLKTKAPDEMTVVYRDPNRPSLSVDFGAKVFG